MQSLPMERPTTIQDLETLIQKGLTSLRDASLSPEVRFALDFILPTGFTPVIQLEEDGRKKRHTAAASNWSPDTGEIVIYYEPAGDNYAPDSTVSVVSPSTDEVSQSVRASESEIRQCCEALDRAEKVGKQFIAYKWFRDTGLLFEHYSWAKTAEDRQRVLSAALNAEAIISSKIFNPKNPQFPTTAVVLNRANEQSHNLVPARFSPVPIRGELASDTIMRERGSV